MERGERVYKYTRKDEENNCFKTQYTHTGRRRKTPGITKSVYRTILSL